MKSLPLLTLHLTERCNSRCIGCDYWRHGRKDIPVETVEQMLPDLRALGTRLVLITGGEPLVHPHWSEIAAMLRANGQQLWLHTAGLALSKHAERIAELFDAITVSLDGVDRSMYARIRGLDAFDRVCDGIRAAVRCGAHVGLRVTVQKANYAALPRFVALARSLAVRNISFLAADVANAHAFGRQADFAANIALSADDLPHFARTLAELQRDCASDFDTGFIAERPQKLRRLLDYYTAICGLAPFPAVRCNAPVFSAVTSSDGRVHPCFFIPGPAHTNVRDGLPQAINDAAMGALRADIRDRRRPECMRCVCSLWRDPADMRSFTLATQVAA